MDDTAWNTAAICMEARAAVDIPQPTHSSNYRMFEANYCPPPFTPQPIVVDQVLAAYNVTFGTNPSLGPQFPEYDDLVTIFQALQVLQLNHHA